MNQAELPPIGGNSHDNLPARHRAGKAWHLIFQAATIIGILVLSVLLLNILDGAFGYVARMRGWIPTTLAVNGVPLEDLPKDGTDRASCRRTSRAAHSTS